MAKKSYTVFGIYGDSQQPWTHWVNGSASPRAAAKRAITELHKVNSAEIDDIFVVDVIEGTHRSLLGNCVVVSLKDLRAKNCPWMGK